MYKPTAKFKKILNNYRTMAYIFRDGVVITENKEVKIDGPHTADITVFHYIPCSIQMRSHMYERGKTENYKFQSVPVSYVQVKGNKLIHGVDSVDVTFNNASQASREQDIYYNGVTIFTPEGCQIEETWIANLVSKAVYVYPDPTSNWCKYGLDCDTAEKFIAGRDHVIRHDPQTN